MNFGELLEIPPFSLNKEQKNELLTRRLKELTHLHQSNCPEYRKILDSLNFDIDSVTSYAELPFLPVRMFKELSLKSIPQEEIVKTMTSSGTTDKRRLKYI